MTNFWKNVKYICKTDHIKQYVLADAIGMDYHVMQSRMNRNTEPKVSLAIKIADELGEYVEDLVNNEMWKE